MTSIDWPTIAAFASTVTVVMGGFLWLGSKIFNLGQISERLDHTAQRLDNVESEVGQVKRDVHTLRIEFSKDLHSQMNSMRSDFNTRIDKLVLTLGESGRLK